jgi:hypothetical protein
MGEKDLAVDGGRRTGVEKNGGAGPEKKHKQENGKMTKLHI